MKYRNWKCPKCGRTVTEYKTLCGSSCDFEKNFFQWLFAYDNPAFYMFLISTGMLILLVTMWL